MFYHVKRSYIFCMETAELLHIDDVLALVSTVDQCFLRSSTNAGICLPVKYFFFCFTGLLTTYVALNLMDGHGQPALLYIVPFTLGMLQEA